MTDPEIRKKLEAVAVNEMDGDALVEELILVSRSYILERDEREMNLLKKIEELSIK